MPGNAAWPWRTWKRYSTKEQADKAMVTLKSKVFEYRLVEESQNTQTSTGKTPADTWQSS
jgi:hypothetical protein